MNSFKFQEVMNQKPRPVFFGVTVSEKAYTLLEVLARGLHIVLSSLFIIAIFFFEFTGVEIFVGGLLSVFSLKFLNWQDKKYNKRLERWEEEVVDKYYELYPVTQVSDSIVDIKFYDISALLKDEINLSACEVSFVLSGEDIKLDNVDVQIVYHQEKPMITYYFIPANLNIYGEDLFFIPTLVISKTDLDFIIEENNKNVLEILKEKSQTTPKVIEE